MKLSFGRKRKTEEVEEEEKKKIKKIKPSSSIIGFDFIGNEVRVVQITKKGKSLRLDKVAKASLPPNAIRGGLVRDELAVTSSLFDLLVENEFSGSRAVIALSGQTAAVRTVRIPKVAKTQIGSTLKSQLPQFIPFKPEEAVWDYKFLREVMEEGVPMYEILIVATRTAFVQPLIKAVQNCGLDVVALKVGAVSMQHVLRKYYEDYAQAVALVDVRDQLSDVIFVSEGSFQLSRTVEFGERLMITRSAQALGITPAEFETYLKEMEINLVEEAEESPPEEETKEEGEGKESEGGEEKDEFTDFDEDFFKDFEETEEVVEEEEELGVGESEILKTLRSAFSNFANELIRSIRYFEARMKRRARVGRIVLVGNVSGYGNLDKFLSEATGMNVVIGNPLDEFDYSDTEWIPPDQKAKIPEITSVVGVVADFLGKEGARLNLVPREFLYKKRAYSALKWILIAAVFAALFLGGVYVKYSSDLQVAQRELDKIKTEQSKYTKKAKEFDDAVKEINTYTKRLKELSILVGSQPLYSYFLDELRRVMPERVWVEELEVSESGEIKLGGKALSRVDAFRFAVALRRSPWFGKSDKEDTPITIQFETEGGRGGRGRGFGGRSRGPVGTGGISRASIEEHGEGGLFAYRSDVPLQGGYTPPGGGEASGRDIETYFKKKPPKQQGVVSFGIEMKVNQSFMDYQSFLTQFQKKYFDYGIPGVGESVSGSGGGAGLPNLPGGGQLPTNLPGGGDISQFTQGGTFTLPNG